MKSESTTSAVPPWLKGTYSAFLLVLVSIHLPTHLFLKRFGRAAA